MKQCSKCHIEKEDSCFRQRKENRRNCTSVYLNNTCRECDAELARLYYSKVKNDDKFKVKNRGRANEYRQNNYERVAEKGRIRRMSEAYKKMRRDYEQQNKDRIHKKSVPVKKRFHEKHRDNLTDEYISNKLFGRIDREFINNFPEIIEAKRLQILIKRKTNNYVKN